MKKLELYKIKNNLKSLFHNKNKARAYLTYSKHTANINNTTYR